MSGRSCEPGLQRRLGLGSVTSIVVANMIGAGIFTTSGLLMADLGDAAVMLALWAAGGAIALCGALCYGELGAAIPEAGGEYAFLSRLFHPVLGFLSGWVSFFAGFSAPIAASAIGCSAYLFEAVAPGGSAGGPVARKICAVALIALFTTVHMRGLRLGVAVQNVLTGLKVALLLALVAAGFAVGSGSFDHITRGSGFVLDLAGWRTVGLSLMWIMFAYSGWNAAAYIGSEIRRPSRNLPLSLLLGTGVVTGLYLLMNLLYVWAVPRERLAGVISVAGRAATELFGRPLGAAVSALVAFALLSSLSAFVILGPRVYYAMARDRLFFRFAAAVHPTRLVPSRSVLAQGVVAAAMVALGTFDQILTFLGFSLGIFPIFAALGVFKLRSLGLGSFRMPGYPVVPVLYVVAGVGILCLAFMERPVESCVAIGTLLAGLPVYVVLRRSAREGRGGRDERPDLSRS